MSIFSLIEIQKSVVAKFLTSFIARPKDQLILRNFYHGLILVRNVVIALNSAFETLLLALRP